MREADISGNAVGHTANSISVGYVAASQQRSDSPAEKRSGRKTLPLPGEKGTSHGILSKQRKSSNSNSITPTEVDRRSTIIAMDLLQNELGEQRRLRRRLEQKLEMCEKHREEEEEAEGRRGGEGDRQKEINRRLESILQAVGGTKSSIVKIDGRMKQLESAMKNVRNIGSLF